MATVYIETSVCSAYVSRRHDAASVYRRDAAHEWWHRQLDRYDVFVSEAVLRELEQGNWPGQAEALALVEPLPRLPIDEEVLAVAKRYVEDLLVPRQIVGDATHLAVACVHEVEFLLTWNVRHLANPNKLTHLTVINRRMGMLTPQIVTPDMLWLEDVQ